MMATLEQIWGSVHEFFTLRHAESLTIRLSLSDRLELRAHLQNAVSQMREAEQAEPTSRRCELAHAALRQLIVIVAAAKLKERSETPVEWPDLLRAEEFVMELDGMQRHVQALAHVFNESHSLVPEHEFKGLKHLFIDLESQIDVRTPRDFLVARWGRATGTLALLAASGWMVFAPTNLAYGKAVTASSICSETPAAPLGTPRLSRLVDGVRGERRFAMCTKKEPGSWILIDLQATHTIRRVAVFPRTDSAWNWTTDDIPVRLELSVDGKHFELVATKTTPLGADMPWYQGVRSKRARYVRLIAGSDGPQQFYLSEVEVYGN